MGRTAPNQDASGATPLVRWMKAGRPKPPLSEVAAQRCVTALQIPDLPKPEIIIQPAGAPWRPGDSLTSYLGGLVYFIDCGEFTKIGHTSGYISRRIDGIATHNPFPLRLWALLKGSQRFERTVHAVCADHRHANEWFRLRDGVKRRLRMWVMELGGETYE